MAVTIATAARMKDDQNHESGDGFQSYRQKDTCAAAVLGEDHMTEKPIRALPNCTLRP